MLTCHSPSDARDLLNTPRQFVDLLLSSAKIQRLLRLLILLQNIVIRNKSLIDQSHSQMIFSIYFVGRSWNYPLKIPRWARSIREETAATSGWGAEKSQPMQRVEDQNQHHISKSSIVKRFIKPSCDPIPMKWSPAACLWEDFQIALLNIRWRYVAANAVFWRDI